MESFNVRRFEELGITCPFVQDNHSKSVKNTLRGLHYQVNRVQDKLVRVTQGAIYDVAVDIRKGSPTYGQWTGVALSFENGKQLLVPRGFLHGFATLEPNTEVIYKCDNPYAPECDGAVRFDDPDIGVDWQIDSNKAILSDKDRVAPLLRDFDSPFTYEESNT